MKQNSNERRGVGQPRQRATVLLATAVMVMTAAGLSLKPTSDGPFAALAPEAAQASQTSYIYRQNPRGGSVCLSWYQGYNGSCRDIMPSGTRFLMRCWADNHGYTGNYYSSRWFFGQSYHNGAWGWVHSSYVYYQQSVPHC